mmetsp:Transcript_59391/g.173751  ORF Transcript_59391/g.173751 Transcript_59391/m.173751 type:complete len:473 (-) Transcript_59391:81-1499(-)
MLSQIPRAVLLTLVPSAASLHRDALLLKAGPVPGGRVSGAWHSIVVDGCLDGNEKLPPLSLIQVNAESKRIAAAARANTTLAAANWTGENVSSHGLSGLPTDPANASHAAKLSVQTQARRVPHAAHRDRQDQRPQPEHSQLLSAVHSVVAVQSGRVAASSEGDAVQGLIFSMIVVIIVGGIYLLVVRDYRPGGDFEAALRGDMATKRPQNPFDARSAPLGQSLLARRSVASGMASGLPTGPLTDPRGSMVRRPEAEEGSAELPMIYPQLVMPVAHTRLAVPVEPLGQPQFEVDVLGLSGVPLLSAALVEGLGSRDVQISLHSVSTLVAVVTSGMDILGADNTHFGTIVKESRPMERLKYVLQDKQGRPLLTLTCMHADSRDFKMTSVAGGRVVERATAVRRPRGKLPAEHYEIVANPNVDAVLVLGCFLAVVVFDPVSAVTGSAFRLPEVFVSGRPSSGPRPESYPSTSPYA